MSRISLAHHSSSLALPFALALAALTRTAAARHDDVLLDVEGGVIVTGRIDKDGLIKSPVRVFEGSFGDTGFPGFTANPGFDCLPGTLQPGTSLGFTVLDAVKVWDGTGFVHPGGETITISFLSLSVTTGDGPVAGFELAVQPDGGFHRHYNMLLNGAEGAPPDPGVYLLERSLFSTDRDVGPSAPFWFVLGHEVEEDEIDAAVRHAQLFLACTVDADGSGVVDGGDLGALIALWNDRGGPGDLDGSGVVDAADLGVVLGAWGHVCSTRGQDRDGAERDDGHARELPAGAATVRGRGARADGHCAVAEQRSW